MVSDKNEWKDVNCGDVNVENTEENDDLHYYGDSDSPVFQSVRVTKKDFSVFELHRKFDKKPKQLVLDVNFQRHNVWNEQQKCELIESVLMGLPLPIFYFKQQDNATFVVVDGKQRLSTLFAFLNNEFQLKGLKILKFLNGKLFEDLTGELGIYQSQLEDYQVYSHVILPPTPDSIIFDIFDRVNRGGTKLNKQEIRNALYHGRGLDTIIEITESTEFETATGIKHKDDNRMKGEYLVTRYLSFWLYYNGFLTYKYPINNPKEFVYNGDIDELLERALTYLNSLDQYLLNKIRRQTLMSLTIAFRCFGRGAFRREFNTSKPVNMNIFETIMYFISLVPNEAMENKDLVKDKMHELITSEAFLSSIGNGRDNVSKVEKRFSLVRSLATELRCGELS